MHIRVHGIAAAIFGLTLSVAHAECMDEVLLDSMTLCLATEQGDPAGRRRVMEILNERDLLSSQQRSKFKEAFSECVRQDARQTENFAECQNFDPRVPLNMGRSILGQPAISLRYLPEDRQTAARQSP